MYRFTRFFWNLFLVIYKVTLCVFGFLVLFSWAIVALALWQCLTK